MIAHTKTCRPGETLFNAENLSAFRNLCPLTHEFPNFEYPSGFRLYSKPENQVLHEAGYDSLITAQYFAVLKEKTQPDAFKDFENKIEIKRNQMFSLHDSAKLNQVTHFSASFDLQDSRTIVEICQKLIGVTHGLFRMKNRLFGAYLDEDKESVEKVFRSQFQFSVSSPANYEYYYNMYLIENRTNNIRDQFDEELLEN